MKKWLLRGALALFALIALAFATGWWLLHGSVPVLDGTRAIAGLSSPVTIQRDHLGEVTIQAANEVDALRALGYVHAQERFFEMDLMRRSAAGELAELFGPIALDVDRQHRVHRLRARDGSSWDAPLVGQPRGDAVLPDASVVDLRAWPASARRDTLASSVERAREVGSNNFAVSGALTRDGRAILADDMHLSLRVPNIWFRARLRYPTRSTVGGQMDVSGLTLPGLPLVVVGSNTHIAWGFTNSYADVADWAMFPPCSQNPGTVGSGCAIRHHRERIAVAGGKEVALDVASNAWGPILAHDAHGDALALRWVAQRPGSLNLGLMQLANSTSVDAALALADDIRMPAQNLAIADAAGAIGWRVLGPVPARTGGCAAQLEWALSHKAQAQVAADCKGWRLRTADQAVLHDLPSGRIWTANNRTLDGAALAQLGDSGYALGARARQIRDDLSVRRRFDERDLLAIQLDDRAIFLQRWWALLRDRAAASRSPSLSRLSIAARTWEGRAATNSVSYRVVRAWRIAVDERLLDGLTAPAQAALGPDFKLPDVPQFEGVAWPLVTQRPMHLLPRRFGSWDALFEDAARDVLDDLGPAALSERTWGQRNTARICHPLAMALPAFARGLLCMRADQLPGDSNMPRVAAPDFGASERMVVSPGNEADGILHMPGGQSGHPLSPYWGAGHDDWVRGRPTPFLPGPAEHTLRLIPAR